MYCLLAIKAVSNDRERMKVSDVVTDMFSCDSKSHRLWV